MSTAITFSRQLSIADSTLILVKPVTKKPSAITFSRQRLIADYIADSTLILVKPVTRHAIRHYIQSTTFDSQFYSILVLTRE